jgi:hypothetical protein
VLKSIKTLFYAIVPSLVMDYWGLKYVVLTYYCACDELFPFVGLHCGISIFLAFYASVVGL